MPANISSCLTLFCLLTLVACGGGGAGGDPQPSDPGVGDDKQEPSVFQTNPQALRERVAISNQNPSGVINHETSLPALSVLYELFLFSQQHYEEFADPVRWKPENYPAVDGTAECRFGGSVEVQFSVSSGVLAIFYFDCVERLPGIDGEVTVSGAQRITWGWDADIERRVVQEYDNYHISAEGQQLQVDGVIEMWTSRELQRLTGLQVDIRLSDSAQGDLVANNLKFELDKDTPLYNLEGYGLKLYGGLQAVTGEVAAPDMGVFSLHGDDYAPMILSDDSSAEASLKIDSVGMVLGFDGDGDGSRERTLYVGHEEYQPEAFLASLPSTPRLHNASLDWSRVEDLGATRSRFEVVSDFRDGGMNLLTYSVELIKVEEVLGEFLDESPRKEIAGVEDTDYLLEQPHAGTIILSSELPQELVVYSFRISAETSHGARTAQSLLAEVPVYRDTDGDGIPDLKDLDDDGDSVADGADAFPKNPTEWVDTDGDGIGNNRDKDDDGDGVSDLGDAQPLDWLCSIESDTNGEVCLHRFLAGGNIPYHSFLTESGVLYFWNYFDRDIYRWDAETQRFLDKITIDPGKFGYPLLDGNRLFYSPGQNKIYVLYGSIAMRMVSSIDLGDENLAESIFLDVDAVDSLNLSLRSNLAEVTPSSLVFAETAGIERDYVSVGFDGNVLDTYKFTDIEQEDALDDILGYRPYPIAPFCTYGVSVNPDSGVFEDKGTGDLTDAPCGRTFLESGVWPAASADSQFALTSEGLVDRFGNLLTKMPGVSPADVVWAGGDLYHIDGENSRIDRYSSAGVLLDFMPVPADYTHSLKVAGDSVVYVGSGNDGTSFLDMWPYRAEEGGTGQD